LAATGFYLIKDNVAVLDPSNDFFFLQLGQGRSQGAEASLTGNITRQWSIVANYAYIDTLVTRDADPTLVGETL